jgi:uncharacterized protein
MEATSPARRLVAELSGYGRTMVAFSGGVDSSVVLAAAVRAVGPAQVAAVTGVSAAVPADELAAAEAFCAGLGIAHYRVDTDEIDVVGYRENGPRRCYFCKDTLLRTVEELARRHGFGAVATGTNASDVAAGFRPGIQAGAQRGARTPLADLRLDKAAVRAIAREWGLSTWDKPAAACLSSRIAYGIPITGARLARVERAEAAARRLLARHGVRDLRVRDLGGSVRLEVDPHLVALARDSAEVGAVLEAAGFGGLPWAVEAFRSGSLNELLPDPQRWRHG